MDVSHYSEDELDAISRIAAAAPRQIDHLSACEQCLYLLALVRRAQGAPSDEEREVTLDALKIWAWKTTTES
jgi:hypothetical protein